MHFNECRFLWLLYWLSVSPPRVYLLDEAPSTEYQLSLLVSVLYFPSLFSFQQIVKQIILNFKEPITRAHIVNLQFYIWAICKTLHQAKDIIFLGSSLY